MDTQNLHNRKLDEIGDGLIKKALLSEAEIDLIAGKAELFDGIRKRIAEQGAVQSRNAALRPRKVLAASAGIFAVIAVIFASFYFAGRGIERATQEIQVPAAEPETARSEFTPQVDEAVNGITPDRAIPQRIVQKPKQPKSAVRKPKAQPIPEVEFYPVTFAGDSLDAARGGRVIRVDMQRSSLFAMGVNVPLENESGTVKADLLVGPDGVTRGIRLVE